MSELGLAYPDRVDKLVYLDAADLSQRFRPDREEPPGPPFTDDDQRSLRDFQAAVARFFGHREPNAARCNGLLFDPSGRVLGSTTPDEIGDKIQADIGKQRPTNWQRIRAPRLGIFATFSLELRQPWYWYLSADEQAAFDRAWPPIVEWHEDTIERFRPMVQIILSRSSGNCWGVTTMSTSTMRLLWFAKCGSSCWVT